MNWQAIDTVVGAVSAVAVVWTLFYVAVQIKHSIDQARRSDRNANLEQASTFRLALAENQDLAEIWARGLERYESLNHVERIRFDALMAQRFWIWAHIFDRLTKGQSGESWEKGRYQINQLFVTNGANAWWFENHHQYPEEFVEEVKRAIKIKLPPNKAMEGDT